MTILSKMEQKTTNSKLPVNPMAETVLDARLKTILTLDIVFGIIFILGGIIGGLHYLTDDYYYWYPVVGTLLLVVGIVIGGILILAGVYRWAQGKVLINISRNLFNIYQGIQNDSSQN